MYQLACAVKHIHSARIVHTDLKPSHVLIDSECQIAVTGFDNTRTDSESIEAKLHDGFVNYWYRSPERLLGSPAYLEHHTSVPKMSKVRSFSSFGRPFDSSSSSLECKKITQSPFKLLLVVVYEDEAKNHEINSIILKYYT